MGDIADWMIDSWDVCSDDLDERLIYINRLEERQMDNRDSLTDSGVDPELWELFGC